MTELDARRRENQHPPGHFALLGQPPSDSTTSMISMIKCAPRETYWAHAPVEDRSRLHGLDYNESTMSP